MTRDSLLEIRKKLTYEELDVYKASLDLAERIYLLTRSFPKEELYGLTSQMRRASVSVASNIAEGWGRGKGAANAQFVRVSRGSVYELSTHVNLSLRLGLIRVEEETELKEMLDRVGKLVQGYLASVEANVAREYSAPYDSNNE